MPAENNLFSLIEDQKPAPSPVETQDQYKLIPDNGPVIPPYYIARATAAVNEPYQL